MSTAAAAQRLHVSPGRYARYQGEPAPGGPQPDTNYLIFQMIGPVVRLEGGPGPYQHTVTLGSMSSGAWVGAEGVAEPAALKAALDRFHLAEYGEPLPIGSCSELERTAVMGRGAPLIAPGTRLFLTQCEPGKYFCLVDQQGHEHMFRPYMVTKRFFRSVVRPGGN